MKQLSGAVNASRLRRLSEQDWTIDGGNLKSIDTAAALFLFERLQRAGISPETVVLQNFSPSHQRIALGVRSRLNSIKVEKPPAPARFLARLGKTTTDLMYQMRAHLRYLGLTFVTLLSLAVRPHEFRWRETFSQIQQTGITAIPVVSLVMFLIGAVIAYLLGLQAEQYGASIYVVDGVALGTVREFSPLLVSTVVAGRSGAAFTAQLGTMKLTEEIDAIRTMGMSAEQVLLLPRVLALMLVLPLLVFIGSVAALAGAALTCDLMLDITIYTFIDRVQTQLSIGHYIIGLVKAPVFALTIAIIGCAMGFTVSRDTRSIGLNTTSTVVQCIVAVVLINALFAVLFQEVGW
jgi:phospholipid/cholesterol/gamma-HCH transport system permease protein